ncbi:nucleotidyltransferase domain-containing protein [Marinilabilia salmonicolor]|uniref:Nucleotidyltransferase-like protein n=1 Tax=Marinilabilia salmonicolor TaxID=989 RepID=A0A368UML0_9BACT|nr:nucleotidyltransferase domain-containing protein [Marinilabilia salmonicolor]RCW30058.1 nucleotidyltransferase-like protein [Marinilabilia salmonicolor]
MVDDAKIESIIQSIIREFKTVGVDKVILFGSWAKGNASENSDIDLIVVAPKDDISSGFREKMNLYLRYNQHIKAFKAEVPIDLIVYTRAGFKKLLEMDSLFVRDILKTGKVLYEANNQGVA